MDLNINWRRVILGSLVFLCVFAGLVKYTLSAAPKIEWESKLVLNEFLLRSQARNYTSAHQLFTSSLRSTRSVKVLSQDWKAFEKAHGPIRNWSHVSGMVSMGYPRFVESYYKIDGQKSGAGTIRVRLTPENGSWRIDRLLIYP